MLKRSDNMNDTFRRYEDKYLLTQTQYDDLLSRLEERIRPDQFCKSKVCSLYFDTPDFRLIRASLEKPVYKEKLRLRSYGVPTSDGTVFLEIKKKYSGIVYKRRVPMTLTEAENYMSHRIHPAHDCQILHEIDWFVRFYGELVPAVCLFYDREAYISRDNPELRFTFDTDILWRDTNLRLSTGAGGQNLLEKDRHLMELKIPGAMPVWLAELLDQEGLRPTSFSKYGTVYQQFLSGRKAQERGSSCA